MKNSVLYFVCTVFLVSCNFSDKKKTTDLVTKNLQATEHPGKKLMETNCYICHSPTADENSRNAPPMIAVKKRYLMQNSSNEAFTAAMLNWFKNPNKDNAIMYGAVQRYGVMPNMPFPEETITQIADYMYTFEIDQPEWFESHYQQEHKQNGQNRGKGYGLQTQQSKNNTQESYGQRGLEYAMATQAVLGKNLMGSIQKDGVLEALSFCNEQAYRLTDSMAVAQHANIRRVTDKPRNQNNKANTEELEYISTFKTVIANKGQPKPIVKDIDNKVHVYYPITTNTMCLQCHGTPNTTMDVATLNKVLRLYPKDKAIDYSENEVRGMWSITFDK
jgi:cytochrome c553